MIVLMAGLPGTGKSTLARELAQRTGGRVLGKDQVRHTIFAPEEVEYSTPQDDFCLELMLETAAYLLTRDPMKMIFLDGRPFSRRYQIANVVAVANSLHQPWRILECVCVEEIVRKRLETDTQNSSHPAANRDFALYLEVKARFEAITHPRTLIDTSLSMEDSIYAALAVLHGSRR